jgi:plastocyanin
MRRKWYLATALGLAVAAVTAGVALAASRGGPVVRTPETYIFIPNGLNGTTMHFEPGAISVKSGATITWINSQSDEPHTITIVKKSERPRTQAQADNCSGCRLALGHLKDPKHPDTSPVKTFVLDVGAKGFDTRGDSLLIVPAGPHKKATTVVSAPAGTTLYYICALHPWMQGSIAVTS